MRAADRGRPGARASPAPGGLARPDLRRRELPHARRRGRVCARRPRGQRQAGEVGRDPGGAADGARRACARSRLHARLHARVGAADAVPHPRGRILGRPALRQDDVGRAALPARRRRGDYRHDPRRSDNGGDPGRRDRGGRPRVRPGHGSRRRRDTGRALPAGLDRAAEELHRPGHRERTALSGR